MTVKRKFRIHGYNRFCQFSESIKFVFVVSIVYFELRIELIFLKSEFFLEAEDDVIELLLDLELDGIDMVLDRVKMLFFLFLPFEQPLNSFDSQHFTMYSTNFSFFFLNFSTQFFHTFTQFHDIKLMSIVSLLMSVAVFAFLTEKRPTLTFCIETYIGERVFAMFGTVKR